MTHIHPNSFLETRSTLYKRMFPLVSLLLFRYWGYLFLYWQQAKKAQWGQLDQTTRGSVWCARKTRWRVSYLKMQFPSACGIFFPVCCINGRILFALWMHLDVMLYVCLVPMAVFLKPFTRSRARWWLSSRFLWSLTCRRSSRRSPSCSNVTGPDTTLINYYYYCVN